MKIKTLFILSNLFWCLFSCDSNLDNVVLISELPIDNLELQQHIIGQLSGHKSLENNMVINARWSKLERHLTRDYLKQLISVLDIEPIVHDYVSPNINPAVDLVFEPFRGSNVYGILPATTKTNDYIILGAHYDTGVRGAPGAVDNASGMTLIFTVIKQMKSLKSRNKNIVIVFFDQEEEENVGSKAFTKLIDDNTWNVHSVHCFDMAGWDGDDNDEFEVYSPSDALIELYRSSSEHYGIPLDEVIIDPIGYDKGSTDFDEFVKTGYNSIGGGECVYKGDYSPYKDTVKDTFETVDFEYLWSNTKLVSKVINNLISD
ncbi:M28 family metallopeptidase [Winogradskyella sp. R77965]|uniref:M28 family metallopeptidase n=1 Tax=Winogradskyella sp. R77965 TaxID=3093872 RepID=UPI0037DD6721